MTQNTKQKGRGMTHDEAAKLVAKHGSQTKAAAAAGVSRSFIRRALERGGAKTTVNATAGANLTVTKRAMIAAGRSLDEFRQAFDKSYIVPRKVKDGLAKMGAGWLYEVDFCKLAGVTAADLGNFRDQFAAHVVRLKERRAWAGTKATADKMRAML